jgi:HAD superfamily hydrolase (TIGR01509 family)
VSDPADPELIIFDCDGVLIDSEVLGCRAESECLAEFGIALSQETLREAYVGISLREMLLKVAHHLDGRHRERLAETIRQKTRAVFEAELQPIPGIEAALDGLPVPFCVASGSEPARLEQTLRLTGLWDRFNPHVFSATQVEHGKPAPDLFLLAASRMGAAPGRCVVLEDSVPGIQAARAAGMVPIGFTGASHCGPDHADLLRGAGAVAVFSQMADLPALLKSGSAGRLVAAQNR